VHLGTINSSENSEEKMAKIIKILKTLIIDLYLGIFTLFVALQIWSWVVGYEHDYSSVFYWLIFIGWIFSVLKFKLSSAFTFISAIALFILAAITRIFNFNDVAETFMRVSFIGWMIGIIQAVVEFRKDIEK